MTTIAVDAKGTFAADTQLTGGGAVNRVQKLYRLMDGGVVGAAGVWCAAYPVLKWMQAGEFGDPPDFEGAVLLIGRPDGTLWLAEGVWPPYPLLNPFSAIGSGAQGAMAGMEAGMTAQAAVETLVAVDHYTSAPVETMRVKRKNGASA